MDVTLGGSTLARFLWERTTERQSSIITTVE